VEYLPQAEKQIELYTRMGFAGLPICMAKTQYSFSADAAAKVRCHTYKQRHALVMDFLPTLPLYTSVCIGGILSDLMEHAPWVQV
jgi:hypothetical protein